MRTLPRLAAALVAVTLLVSACGSDDSDDDATTTEPSDQSSTTAALNDTTPAADADYCDVVRNNPSPPADEVADFLADQLAVAPAELEADLQELVDNAALFEDELTDEERAQIQEPLERVVTYQVQECGIPLDSNGG